MAAGTSGVRGDKRRLTLVVPALFAVWLSCLSSRSETARGADSDNLIPQIQNPAVAKPVPAPPPVQQEQPVFPARAGRRRLPPRMFLTADTTSRGTTSLVQPDRSVRLRLRRVPALVAAQNYVEATQTLQQLLEQNDEAFLVSDDEKAPVRSLKNEILRQLSDLPAAAQDVYELQYGPAAKRLLEDATSRGQADKLQTLNRKFLHTRAGTEGAYRLAGLHLDEGEYLAAVRLLERVRLYGAAEARARLEPGLSLKLALAWHRQGEPERAVTVLRELQKNAPKAAVLIGGQETPLLESPQRVLAWLDQRAANPETRLHHQVEEWQMSRGDATRTAASVAVAPYLNGPRRASLLSNLLDDPGKSEKFAREFREQYAGYLANTSASPKPAIPAWQPLVVSGLAIVRTIGDLRAYHLSSGQLAWVTSEKDDMPLRLMDLDRRDQWMQNHLLANMLMKQRIWLDSTHGTLSSDGRQVFAVEDLGFVNQFYPNVGWTPHPLQARMTNRIKAYDTRTGRLISEYPPGDDGDANSRVFFLGPPLVLEDRLYCIAEALGELRLMVLKSSKEGLQLDWWQPLLNTGAFLSQEPLRRMCGISPASYNGLLVCPTEAGGVAALDLETRTFAWGYLYGKSPTRDLHGLQSPAQLQRLTSSQQLFGGNDESRWLDSATVISGQHVVMTLRDADELHCINLSDGTLAWKKPREEGLFLAAVHDGKAVVVSRGFVQAYNLADGKPVWPQPLTIPLPSGQGFRHESNYYLPLTTAEVATIDLRSGQIIARSQSREGIVPGNLAGAEGRIVSLTADSLDIFPQFDTLDTQITGRLLKNPRDAGALVLRGEIELQRGHPQVALGSLREALNIQSDEPAVQAQLLSSLLEGLRVDFPDYRKLSAEIERLAVRPEDRGTLLFSLETGYEKQGDLREAFSAGLKFCERGTAVGELERIEDNLSVRRDQLIYSRLRKIYSKADPALRREFNAIVSSAFQAARERRDSVEIGRWLEAFPDWIPATEARELLVDLLQKQGTPLERERVLAQLRKSQDKKVAGPALARTTAMMVETERIAAVPELLITLRRQFAEVVCLDGKTGVQLAEQWEKQPAVAGLLKTMSDWPAAHVNARHEPRLRNAREFRFIQLPVQIISGSAFEGVRVEINQGGDELVAWDRFGRRWWSLDLVNPDAFSPTETIRVWAYDHLLLVALQRKLIAIDTLSPVPPPPATGAANKEKQELKIDEKEDEPSESERPAARILWQLTETSRINLRAVMTRNGQQRIQFLDESGRPTGAVGPITDRFIGVQRGRKILGIEPLTGRTLWVRDVPGSFDELVGDADFLLAIAPGGTEAEVFASEDGFSLGSRPVPAPEIRQAFHGRCALVWEPTPDGSRVRLASRDVPAQSDRWEQFFPAGSVHATPQAGEIAVVEPQGRFTLLRSEDGQKLLEARLEANSAASGLLVLKSLERIVAIVSDQIPPEQRTRNPIDGNGVMVSGAAYGIDRMTGRRVWSIPVENQGINRFQSSELPLVVFASQQLEHRADRRSVMQSTSLLCVDPRSGRILYNQTHQGESFSNQGILSDPSRHRLEIRLYKSVVSLEYKEKPDPPQPQKPAAPPATPEKDPNLVP